MNLVTAKIVLLGNFNPYIVTPQWLKKLSIWESPDTRLSSGSHARDSIQFRGGGTEWQVATDRLVIVSTPEQCGKLAKDVLDALPHTPMSAVLSSFSVDLPTEEAAGVQPIFSGIAGKLPSESKPVLNRWGVVLHEDDVRIDLMFVLGDQGASASVNQRRTTPDADTSQAAAAQFVSDHQKALQLVEHVLRAAR